MQNKGKQVNILNCLVVLFIWELEEQGDGKVQMIYLEMDIYLHEFYKKYIYAKYMVIC